MNVPLYWAELSGAALVCVPNELIKRMAVEVVSRVMRKIDFGHW